MEYAKTQRSSLDLLVYPVLFLYRHHSELALKMIIRDASLLLDDDADEPKGHILSDLWTTVKKLLARVESPKAVEALGEEGRVLNAFHALDPRSTTFRYPKELDGSKPLASQTHISYKRIREKLEPVSELLDGIVTMLDDYSAYAAEAAADAYSDYAADAREAEWDT